MINLYQDSGRFGSPGNGSLIASPFTFPGYMTPYNDVTITGLGKFIFNNADFGGTLGNMHPEVKGLIEKIRDPGQVRRYGNEFWVAEMTVGNGQGSSPFSADGFTVLLNLYSKQQLRLPAMTFHCYLRARDQAIIIRKQTGQRCFVDCTEKAGSFAISPADGWKSILVQDNQDPRSTVGHQPSMLTLYAQNSGDRYLMACPALVPGIANITPDIGIIAGYNSWSV